jgi:hypothetical protein
MSDFFDYFFATTGLVERPEQSAWQRAEVALHNDEPKRAIFASPRLGKSLPALAGLADHYEGRALITCPLVACSQWATLVEAAGLPVLPHYRRSTADTAAALLKRPQGVLILNDDKLPWLVEEIKKWNPTAIIGDESHRFAGVTAKRARAFRRLAWQATWVRILTGTPVPNHYGSLWGQGVALDREAWGTSYERYATRFLIRDAMFPSRVLGYQNEPELFELIRRFATIKRREDVFGPDTWQTVRRDLTLPPAAARVYEKLAKDWILDVPFDLEATNTLARMMRLHQVTSGFLRDDATGGTLHELHAVKREAIVGDLEEVVASDEKAVVFHQFTPEGHALYADIGRAFPNIPVLKIDGDTPTLARDLVYDTIERHPGAAVAVVQTQSGGIARSFAQAKHVLFASRGFSFVGEEQARDRVYAPGAVRVVYDYVCAGTIDEYILDVLTNKYEIHSAIRNADRHNIVFGPKAHKRKWSKQTA